MRQQALYKIIGMQKDVADSAMDKQHAFDLHNMRLSHSNSNTLAALVNEEGTLRALDAARNAVSIKGTVIGFNTLNDQAILFTHEEENVGYYNYAPQATPNRGGSSDAPASDISGLCTFVVTYDGRDYLSNDVVNFNIQDNGGNVINIGVHVTGLNDPDNYKDDEIDIRIAQNTSGLAVSLYEDSASSPVHHLSIPTPVESPEDNLPYDFIIRIETPARTTSKQTFYFTVEMAADVLGENGKEEHVSSVYAMINIPADTSGGEEPEPGPDPSDTTNSEIEKFPEETDTTVCDHIYILTAKKTDDVVDVTNDVAVDVFEYFKGNLGFDVEHPIESTVYFENEKIQKVYWVDGIHVMRYANIADRNGKNPWTDNLMFDSVPLLHLQETVTVRRNSTGGMFPSGTVQWAFTYMKRYGTESNIAWISPIYYSSPDDRGGAPGETCANSFTITINNYEPSGRFDYIRLYHILRTSLDAEAEVRRVADIPIPPQKTNGSYPPVVFTDTSTTGESVDPSELLYLGGVSVYPGTIEQKSNTLFLGNLEQQFKTLQDALTDSHGTPIIPNGTAGISFTVDESEVNADSTSGYYSHENQLKSNSQQITSFRRGETYRFGFQAQDKTGRWSDVWWLGDDTSTKSPTMGSSHLSVVHAAYTLSGSKIAVLRDNGYRKIRPVIVYPKPWERNIYTEGLLNPTVYNVKDRSGNAPYAQSSWFLRPFPPLNIQGFTYSTNNDTTITLDKDGNLYDSPYRYPYAESHHFTDTFSYNGEVWTWLSLLAIDSFSSYDYSSFGSPAEFRHNYPLGDSQQRNGEIQSMYNTRPSYDESNNERFNVGQYSYQFPYVSSSGDYTKNCDKFISLWSDFFYVDQSIFTMNSADVQFDQALQAQSLDSLKFRVTGIVPISSFISSYDIITNTPPNKFYTEYNNSLFLPQGFYGSEVVGADMSTGHGYKSFINGAIWHDEVSWMSSKNHDPYIVRGSSGYSNDEMLPVGFAVYPWQGTGSLNNDSIGTRRVYPSDTDNSDKNGESRNAIGDNYISAELKQKTLANLHYSRRTHYIDDLGNSLMLPSVAKIVLDTQSVSLTRIDGLTNLPGERFNVLNYFGNVDKLITPVSGFLSSEEATADEAEEGTEQRSGTEYNTYPMTRRGGYPLMVSYLPYYSHANLTTRLYDTPSHLAFSTAYTPLGTLNTLTGNELGDAPWKLRLGSDRKMTSIPIKYNSCNHIVVALDYTDGSQSYLGWNPWDQHNASGFGFSQGLRPFWHNSSLTGMKEMRLFSGNATFNGVTVNSSSANNLKWITFNGKPQGFLYMGQLYRTGVTNRFGGNTAEAVEHNVWLPAGNAIYLPDPDNQPENWSGVTLKWTVGDSYYQRYDALRTYPQTEEDVNKVVDIVSFMTETWTNIDGRYDKNRGLTNNNHIRPQNFNLINPVYSQQDNFFTYHTINPKKVNLDVFEYSFTWSLTKIAGALRDEWTRLTFASTYDCDGNKGPLNRIERLDNQLVAFQENGVAQILFNENVQIQGSEGIPIELANSGKLQGLRYYTTEIGCQNKWSISVQPNGIYWVDGKTRGMYVLGGNGIQSLSSVKGVDTWFRNRDDLSTVWHPGQWQGFFMHNDNTTGELFLTSKDTCLCFDTALGEYTGFYDYQKTDAMFTVSNTVFSVAEDFSVPDGLKTVDNKEARFDCIWLHRKNTEHCFIYGKQRPAWIELVCNSNNQGNDYGMDKVFDNLEWRADAWYLGNGAEEYKPFVTFDSLSGSTHYQTFDLVFDAVNGNANRDDLSQLDHPAPPLNLRKKFKVWRTTIPRSNESKTEARPTGSDRIRDTWCHIKLELSSELSNYRHILHDIAVTYFIP